MDSLKGLLLLIAAAVVIIAAIKLLDLGGHFVPSAKRPKKAKATSHDAARLEAEVGKVIGGYVEREPVPSELTAEARFRAASPQKIEPLLDGVAREAVAAGNKANVARNEGDSGLIYRLEIERSDHMADQPLPYITLAAGKEKDVAVVIGGTFPGPRDENGHRTEVDWYEIDWSKVDDELLAFTRKVFKQF